MSESIWARYGSYPKKKGKKKTRREEGNFLKKTYDWLQWRRDKIGGVTFYHPCLQH